MTAARSDALVFFGATGDLAFKQIFPALQGMARTGKLDMPVIGIAKQGEGYTVDNLRERARRSVEEHGGLDPKAFEQLSQRLGYVDGDYRDATTFRSWPRRSAARSVRSTTWPSRPACSAWS